MIAGAAYVFTALLLLGAGPAPVGGTRAPLPDPPAFGVVFRNMAWGYRERGCGIQEDGDVLAWSVEGRPSRREERLVGRVSSAVLEEVAPLVVQAAGGRIVTGPGSTADFGTVTAFVRYAGRKVVLSVWGDVEQRNEAPAAAELVEWLYARLPDAGCIPPGSSIGRRNGGPG